MTWLAYFFFGLVLTSFGLFAYTGLRHLTRETPIERIRPVPGEEGECRVSHDAFREKVETYLDTPIVDGNAVEVLFDGATFDRLFEDLAKAERLITWHVYWQRSGKVADRLAAMLAERARAGVTVLFLYDAYGSQGLGKPFLRTLEEAGVEVAVFRPLVFNELYKFQQRSHKRSVVIDGRIGYTGGFALADAWQGGGRKPNEWRDTNARVEGPVVRRLQAAFATEWAEATGELLFGGTMVAAEPVSHGQHEAGLLVGKPTLGSTPTERFFALSIACAHESLYVTNAYFIPNRSFRRMLANAVSRGVDVRVLIPGRQTNKIATYWACRAFFEELLDAGVRLFEYQPTMVHAKTLVVDRMWSGLGTANFDNRSMALNDEIVLMVRSSTIGEQLHERFLTDLEHSAELRPDDFRDRGWWAKLQEQAALAIFPLL